MTNEDARSLPGAAQAALRKRAVQAVLDGMTQAEAARVFRVHPNAVNRWVKRYRAGGWDGFPNGAVAVARVNSPPFPNRNSKRSSRWCGRRPPTSSAYQGFCGLGRRSGS